MTIPTPTGEPRNTKAEAAATSGSANTQRPWFKKKRWMLLIGFLVLVGIGAASQPQDAGKRSAAKTDSSAAKSDSSQPATKRAPVKDPEPPKPELTTGQKNALEAGQNYIDMSGFSKAGLIQQLSSSAGDGYSRADAEYAAAHVDVDWNNEAVEAAKDYLDMSPMSKSGLIEQLSSSAGDKFTDAQARYAAEKVY